MTILKFKNFKQAWRIKTNKLNVIEVIDIHIRYL